MTFAPSSGLVKRLTRDKQQPPKEPSLSELRILMSGLVFPESPRWHDHHLWFSDWGAHEVIALDLDGKSEVIARVPSFPMCIDRLPDGRLLIVSASDGLLLCKEPDGSLATYADLTDLADHCGNARSAASTARRGVVPSAAVAAWTSRVVIRFRP